MLQDDVQLVSVDDHVIEHPRVWSDRLPAHLRDRGPQVQERQGKTGWVYDGHWSTTVGLNAVAGKPFEERGVDPARYEDMRPGCYDVKARLEDMRLDGVHASLCFPDFPGFAGRRFVKAPDKDLALLCVRAWNDFMLDEWCGADPERFIPMVILPTWDVGESVAEIERTAAKGALAISFPEMPDGMGLPSLFTDHWDSVLAAAQAASLPLCMHFGTGGTLDVASDRPLAVRWTLAAQRSMAAAVELLFSPVFHRFPDLKVCLSEGGIGWIPYALERADYIWDRHRWYQDVDRSVRPSDLAKGRIFGCFISDATGLRDRHAIGIEHIMWEGDYPHADSDFPNSRSNLAKELADIPDAEAALIAEGNARSVFRFPRPARVTT